MKISLVIVLLTICCLVNSSYSQKIAELILVGSWFGGEDFGEFIYHKIEEIRWNYLKENPQGKIIARLCSKSKMSVALVSSSGFAFKFLDVTRNQAISDQNVYLARSAKCGEKSEQYWFVPENTVFEYDEIILAENVEVNRLIESYHENSKSKSARNEFAENTKKFIKELQSNPKAEGFIIRNIKTRNRYFQQVLKQIKKEKIDIKRIQIVSKKIYRSYYPEFMTVTINN